MHQIQPAPNPADIFRAAIRAFTSRDWTEAEALCRQVLFANPRHAGALHMLGLVFSETGRVGNAIIKLREAISQQPADPLQWMNLGIIYHKAGQFADAAECQRRAIALKENFPEAHFNLGLACRALGEFDNAIAAVRMATQLRPGYADAYYLLGNLLREEGRLKDAVAAYQTALQIRPGSYEPHLNIAAAWLELGEPAKAIEHYCEVVRLDPASSAAENSMGHALRALGRIDEAKAAYARAESIDGKSGDPMSVLARESLAELIPPDHESIAEYKQRVNGAVQAFATERRQPDLSHLDTHGAVPSVMLAYYGGNLRQIMEQYGQAIAQHIPRSSLRPRQGKPRLGIVVTQGHEGIFARCWGGIAERLSRELVDVSVLCSRVGANILQTILQIRQNEYLRLPTAVDAAARLVAA